ncbi:MAG TPA: NAD(P)-dependent alcohol dehydrogenase [Candidatus Acidoferrum sp.]|nr:NAD(P)-dependent alcohol dehydrogenase [Candidatus Acidoferrum sp.]
MKAAIYTRYGPPDVVQIVDVEKPIPKDDEVLIKVRAASVNPLDWRLMRGVPSIFHILFRLRKPTDMQPARLGHDVAGQVEAVGKNVTQFKPDDEVFGSCHGALAQYACASESKLARKPDNVTFEQAASVPVAALTALQGLRDKGHLQPGQKVLINGAAGGVGTFSVQIAKSFGADVTGVCSTKNIDLVRFLGADRVIDYTREDFAQSGQHYDLILDNVGNLSLSACRRVLNPKGVCVIAGAPKDAAVFFLTHAIATPVLSQFVSQKFVMFMANINKEDLATLGNLMRAGKVTPVIDRRYSLTEVADALRYLEEGHARGKVVIILE